MAVALSVMGPPVNEGQIVLGGVVLLGRLVRARVSAQPGSRWSARSAARTYDLDAGEH
jgi:hypothetical protein